MFVVMKEGEQFKSPRPMNQRLGPFQQCVNQIEFEYEILDFEDAEHYNVSGYLYTRDIIDDYYDVSTAIHRTNAKFGMAKAF